MRKLIPLLVSGFLVVGLGACGNQDQAGTPPGATNETGAPAKEAAQTTPDLAATPGAAPAPETATTPGAAPAPDAAMTPGATGTTAGAPGDTTSATGGTATTPTDGATTTAAADLPAAITSKLTEKMPNGNFTVEAKDGAVVVSGTVPSATEKKRIEPLVKEVKGVKTVKVDVKVEPTKAPTAN